eukprot:scaffold1307_cov200-Pinguiococcus_pyrenoidosus.AAC.121
MTSELLSRKIDRGGGNRRRQVFQHAVLQQAALANEGRHVHHAAIGVSGLEVPDEEVLQAGQRQPELQRAQDGGLHFEDLVLGVRPVRHVDQVAQLRRIDLFVLARQEKASDPDKLQAIARHLLDLKVTVDQRNAKMERLGVELELQVHFNLQGRGKKTTDEQPEGKDKTTQRALSPLRASARLGENPPYQPVHQDRTHLLIDVHLLAHVVGVDPRVELPLAEVGEHVFHVLRHSERVLLVAGVDVIHAASGARARDGRRAASNAGAGLPAPHLRPARSAAQLGHAGDGRRATGETGRLTLRLVGGGLPRLQLGRLERVLAGGRVAAAIVCDVSQTTTAPDHGVSADGSEAKAA